MKRLGYLEKLSLAARWFLPYEEAVEIIEDYREMIAGGEDGKAEERFGPPVKAVLKVAEPVKRWVWSLFFAGALVVHFFFIHWARHHTYYNLAALTMAAVIVGLLLYLLGVGKLRNPFNGLPKRFIIVLVVFILFIILMFTPSYYLLRFCSNPYPWFYDQRFFNFLSGCLVVFSLVSVGGIVLARLIDKRWRAVSILSLTIVVMAMYLLSGFSNMDPRVDLVIYVIMKYHEGNFVAVAGILTAGVSLC